MDVEAHIARLERLMAGARPVPLSASVMVHRQDFDELLGELRAQLPEELRQSRWIIKEREEIIRQATRDAERVVADARAEQERLVSEAEVVRAARRDAERILEEAHEQARSLRLEAEDYIDGKLANFEIVLHKTLRAVERGRERLRGRLASDELAQDGGERGAAPQPGGEPEPAVSQLYDHEAGRPPPAGR